MTLSKPLAALGAGCLVLLGMAGNAQTGGAAASSGGQNDQVVVLQAGPTGPKISWIEKSKVAALREGVIEKMELQLGMPVRKDGVIGVLHHEIADLTVRKNELQAKQIAPVEKARAQKEVAASTVARNIRLNTRSPGLVSQEDVAKAEGELKVAEAQIKEALENTGIAEAELAMAKRIAVEHTIVAPFDGVVLKRMKDPGESVRANEAVVELGNLSKVIAEGYVPLEYVDRIKEGLVVEIQPHIRGSRGEPLPIEKKRFRGKISFVDPQIQAVAETAIRIRAAFDNPDFELRPGLWVSMTIFLNSDVAAASAETAGSTRTARSR
jgi:RND family efflux transporter MFP subunit